MRPEAKKHVFDMLTAAEAVAGFARGRNRRDYETDLMFRSAVERQLQILGEARVRLRREDRAAAEQLTHAREIIGFRNVLVHAYDQVDESVVWGIVEKYLAPLTDQLKGMLEESETPR